MSKYKPDMEVVQKWKEDFLIREIYDIETSVKELYLRMKDESQNNIESLEQHMTDMTTYLSWLENELEKERAV